MPVKTFVLSHAIWIVALAVAVVLGHAWLTEHDRRLAAESQIKTSEATVATLQQQITQTNAQAAAKVQTVVKMVRDIQTPTQAIAAIPQLTDMPLNARQAPDNPAQVSVDAIPFVNLLAQAKTDQINLGACQSDLKSQTAITAQKDIEIKALKKRPSFWKRVEGTAKSVGVGIGIGLLFAGHL